MAAEPGAREPAVARLARLGFGDAGGLGPLLSLPTTIEITSGQPGDELIDALAGVADPAMALRSLVRLLDSAPDRADLLDCVRNDARFRGRLVAVLGGSLALGDHLARHPAQWRDLAGEGGDRSPVGLRTEMITAVGADPAAGSPRSSLATAAAHDALRVAYRKQLLQIAARDLEGGRSVTAVAAQLADLAAATLEAALAVARAEVPDGASVRLAVIGMGKCGGRELNYVSDVDVIFVAEPTVEGMEADGLPAANRLAAALIRACGAITREGTIWPVDAALRPEGNAGPLVRTLASHRAYYERWAKTWEFQALLKARPVAGDLELGGAFVDAVWPLVWSAAERDGFVADVQAMRRRVESAVPAREAGRQLKLGPGGLRDVEFAVQLLQLVHGRGDEALRSGTTLDALQALIDGGYVGRADGAELAGAYEFLRSLEHRIQLHRLRRTHVLPDHDQDLRRLGRSLGFRTEPARELGEAWRTHTREVRRLHERIFYRPLLSAVARLPGDQARLSAAAARQRLEALGYADPAGALRHLEALTAGTSRAAAIQRTLLPVLLGWFADGADPDAGLLGFRRVSEALGGTQWYLRVLRDEGASAERLARLLASSRLFTELLLRAPDAVTALGADESLRPRLRDPIEREMRAAAGRSGSAESAVAAIRAIRRRELLRATAADLLGLAGLRDVETALTAIAAATLESALEAAATAVLGGRSSPVRIAIIGMGRLGGGEQAYGSDADVLFVYEAEAAVEGKEAADTAHAIANELRRLLGAPGTDPPLGVDADLRPEGRQGPLVRTLEAYATYHARWSHPWETQALLRAAPICGDPDLGARFQHLVDPIRWPVGGVPDGVVREIRRIKARVESERLPRGKDPRRNVKLGPGGLTDVEWTVQLLQLRHAGDHPQLRTTSTRDALDAAEQLGLLTATDREVLETAWVLASRIRNAIMLASGRSSNTLPTDVRALDRVARLLGHGPGEASQLLEDHLRTTRRARAAVERLFYA